MSGSSLFAVPDLIASPNIDATGTESTNDTSVLDGAAYYVYLQKKAEFELPESVRHQIEIDLTRTFPDSKTALSSEAGRKTLRRVFACLRSAESCARLLPKP